MPAWFYVLRLRSRKLYLGSTRSKLQRYADHFSGRGCKTTRADPPIAVVYEEEFQTYKEAFRRERQVKRWTRAKKEALICGAFGELKRLSRRRKKC